MKRTVLLWLIAIACCSAPIGRSAAISADSSTATPPAVPIPATLFGMHVHYRSPHQPWPTVTFGSFRMLENVTSWARLNPSEGNYQWGPLDAQLDDLKAHGVDDVLYTFDKTPSWTSTQPNEDCGARGREGKTLPGLKKFPGSCEPPNDLKPDGSGSNKHWRDFVTALVIHAKSRRGARIRYWEIWNEPHNEFFWAGTFPQMVRMARDAYTIIKSIDPDALVLSPSGGSKWLDAYFNAGGAEYSDVISLHGYIHSGHYGDYPKPPNLIRVANEYRDMLAKHHLSSKPIWNTEASWGNASVMGFEGDEDFQISFLAQFYLINWSLNLPRLYWFAWNDGTVGRLWIPDPGNPDAPGRPTKAATAYSELYRWLVGATMTKPCAADGGLWTCNLTKPDGHEAQIVWADSSQKNYTPKASLKKTRELDGKTSAVSGAIPVGTKPVLLESQ